MSKGNQSQRARHPEQKEERRQHLLATARALLLDGLDVNALGLNELARQAGMTKSNVYRYYESREAVLLDVLEEELALWSADFEHLSKQPLEKTHAIAELAKTYATTLVRRPLLCSLSSILSSIIEHNISLERVIEFKRRQPILLGKIASAINAAAPTIKLEQVGEFIRLSVPLFVGLWPISHPSAAVKKAISLPELASLRYDFKRDLEHALQIMLTGIVENDKN
ncbi:MULTISPECIES: TetR/AcrR family transcriptional regulator [unclassified Burkholderia]|uniref:TetR/AcrR family transcriptional regulator n=1 Tax=unclassified Burkholderia TaxID=2613784 RepID=UPI002AB12D9A|nr:MULTISPECIES: TetR/AcrR family transcriptional regulator [unclassified Burkholderia]